MRSKNVSDLSNFAPKLVGTVQNGSRLLLLLWTASSRLSSFLFRRKAAVTVFEWPTSVSRYGQTLKVRPCLGLRSPPGSSSYLKYALAPNCQHKHISCSRRKADRKCRSYKGGWKTDPCGTPFIRCHNLLCFLLPVVRVKLLLLTSSMITRSMCLSGRSPNSLQMRPRYQTVL